MAERAALVTGASSGIGLAIADVLGQEGYALTVAARRPEKLEAAADGLRAKGYAVQHVAGDLGDEDTINAVVAAHAQRYGRLDVLVNNAGVGMGEPADALTTKKIDIQLNTNLRAIFLFYRAALPHLRKAGEEHRNARVINTASISGIRGEPWVSVYSATKHGVVGYTEAMNKELASAGIKSTALCPGFVDTPMAEWSGIPGDQMIQPEDCAEIVRMCLRLSPHARVPQVVIERAGSKNGDVPLSGA